MRPKSCRRVGCRPDVSYFKPRGVPTSMLEEVVLSVDEFEAVRLADLDGLYQKDAAARMNVSRPTFGRIIGAARAKIAEALVKGKALKIEGGVVEMAAQRRFRCTGCGYEWALPYGTGRPLQCPSCKGDDFRRIDVAGDGGGCGGKR